MQTEVKKAGGAESDSETFYDGGNGSGEKRKSWYLLKKKQKGILIWGSVVFFTLLYLSLIFNNNVWTDEIFSMNLFRLGFGQIIEETAKDVHPPLYYFLGRIFRLLFGESLQVQKVLTLLPMSLTLVLGAVKVRKYFGDRTSFFFVVLLGCIPCSMAYAVQVRMYSWALLCVTACGLAAWEIYMSDRWRAWLCLAISAVAAAYLHYFAFVSVIIINGLLFLALLFTKEKRKSLGKWLLFSLLMTVLYLPWMPYFYEQITRVEAGYWIPPITKETVWSYFVWAFGLAPLPQTTYIFLGISLLAGISCVISVKKGREKTASEASGEPSSEAGAGVFALLCMAVPALTAACGIVLSLLKQPIYRDQYVFPAMGLFCLFIAVGCRRFRKETAALLLVFFLAVGAISYRDNYRAEYRATLTAQTEEFFSENLSERDLVVYNYQAYYFNYKYYFPEERLFYVRDVDLSQDFDRIWFLDTEMEWEFVPDQIIPYQLQIEYVGHYGIEDNEFDLYRVTKGTAP